jgi:ssDNA-binding Zn-finger/Zn-ribbon topoisomerase 1
MSTLVDKGKPGDPCPLCGKPLVTRFRRADGSPFLGCSRYPDCRGVREFTASATPPAALPRSAGGRPMGFWDTEEYRAFEAARRARKARRQPASAGLAQPGFFGGLRRWWARLLANVRH